MATAIAEQLPSTVTLPAADSPLWDRWMPEDICWLWRELKTFAGDELLLEWLVELICKGLKNHATDEYNAICMQTPALGNMEDLEHQVLTSVRTRLGFHIEKLLFPIVGQKHNQRFAQPLLALVDSQLGA